MAIRLITSIFDTTGKTEIDVSRDEKLQRFCGVKTGTVEDAKISTVINTVMMEIGQGARLTTIATLDGKTVIMTRRRTERGAELRRRAPHLGARAGTRKPVRGRETVARQPGPSRGLCWWIVLARVLGAGDRQDQPRVQRIHGPHGRHPEPVGIDQPLRPAARHPTDARPRRVDATRFRLRQLLARLHLRHGHGRPRSLRGGLVRVDRGGVRGRDQSEQGGHVASRLIPQTTETKG